MKRNIFPEKSQIVDERLSRLSPDRVLLVPMDYAKKEHTVQLCLGTGELLLGKPLRVYNSPEGVSYLQEKVREECKQRRIALEDVIVGLEDPPEFVHNFLNRMLADGYACVRVNPKEAKKFRTNSRASSDSLDLNGIAQAVLNRQCRDIRPYEDIYSTMRNASRSRRKLVKERTRLKNRIHKHVDILCPGFLDMEKSGIHPFSKASMWLMGEDFSAGKIRRMRTETLEKRLREFAAEKPDESAVKLKALAGGIIPPAENSIGYYSASLSSAVGMYREMDRWIATEESQMARCLVQTPGFYLTSIPGIAVVIAAGIMGECGNPDFWPGPDSIASYGGIAAREKQTGGSGNAAVQFGLPRDANRRLKDLLLQAGFNMGKFRHPAGRILPQFAEHRLYRHFWEVENRGSKSGLSTAKLFLKIAYQMTREKRFYLPEKFIKSPETVTREENIGYLSRVFSLLKKKWESYDLSGIDRNKNYLAKEAEGFKSLLDYVKNQAQVP